MTELRHILAATDLSPASLDAVDRGFTLAQAHDVRYTVLHALGLEALAPLRGLLGEQAGAVSARLAARQSLALEEITADPARNRGVQAELRVEAGLPLRTVPAFATQAQVDLVVLGARGENAARRLVLGSTASHLLRKSASPVLLVRNPVRGPYRRVLLPIDFSPASARAIALVRALAPEAQLVLLHVFEVPFAGLLHYAGVGEDVVHRYRLEARANARQRLDELAREAGLAESDCSLVAEDGHPARVIVEKAEQLHCDLIAMGKHGTHVTEELLIGSVTKRVLEGSTADVLVVVDARPPVPDTSLEAP